jgi:molybdate transport system ATP-binding protein
MTLPLVRLDNVDVALDGQMVLRRLSWRLLPGENWAVLGANGSGKSTFLRLVRGELWPAPGRGGTRIYALDGGEQTSAVGIKEKFALVSPELQARYLQQEWKLTGWQVVHSGLFGGDCVYQRLTPQQLTMAEFAIRLLGVEALLTRNVQELSTGELRKVLIARALSGSPRVLVCDEICDGLDAASRGSLLEALGRIARNGTQLLYTTHRSEEFIPALTHRLVLDRGRIAEQGALKGGNSPPPSFPGNFKVARVTARGACVRDKVSRPISSANVLISIKNADVFLGARRVLHNIDWQLRAGEHWAIVGPNGAGKSTLLKLIAGDLHPALGGRVQRFVFTSKNTLSDIRRRIGVVSPELQANYREALTGAEVIASGFFSSIGLREKPTARQRQRGAALVEALGLGALADPSVRRISYGEFRKILLARALVRGPEILLFDEPFDGLDARSKAEMTATLEKVARRGTSLVFVTHHSTDLPACTTHMARLSDGRIVEQGPVR